MIDEDDADDAPNPVDAAGEVGEADLETLLNEWASDVRRPRLLAAAPLRGLLILAVGPEQGSMSPSIVAVRPTTGIDTPVIAFW